MPVYLRDNVKARQLLPDATYERVVPVEGETPFRSQQELLQLHQQNS